MSTYLLGCDIIGAAPSLGTPQLKLDTQFASSKPLPSLVPPPSQEVIDARKAQDEAAVQAAQAVLDSMNRVSTPAQAQQAAAQTVAVAAQAQMPPEVKIQAAQAQQAAAQAVTPAQVQAAKDQLEVVLAAIKAANKPSMPGWQIALITGGAVAGAGLLVAIFASLRTARAS